MRNNKYLLTAFGFIVIYFISFIFAPLTTSAIDQKIYDEANLLSQSEITELERLSEQLGSERETDFIILTTNDTGGLYIKEYMQNFYDEMAPGYDGPHGNTAILALDMTGRDVYLAGFYKAETYLDDSRLDKIRGKITPYLSNGDYYRAFEEFMILSHEYMGYEPGYNPDNILFKWWFQLLVSIVVGALVVGIMAFNSGGRVSVSDRTYMDSRTSRVLSSKDEYVRTTVTKRRKPQQNSGGGGGVTGGGHSHSGSGGKF